MNTPSVKRQWQQQRPVRVDGDAWECTPLPPPSIPKWQHFKAPADADVRRCGYPLSRNLWRPKKSTFRRILLLCSPLILNHGAMIIGNNFYLNGNFFQSLC